MSLWSWLTGRGRDPNAELRALVETKTLQLQNRFLESQLNSFDNLVLPDYLWDTPDFYPGGLGPYGPAGMVPPYVDSMKRGEVLPVYLTEYQLKLIRDQSRRLLRFNEYAICASENRKSYIVGKGFKYECSLKEGIADTPDNQAAVEGANRVLRWFQARNNWPAREREAVFRADRDGDAFLRLFHVGRGRVVTRFVEPEHVRSPYTQPESWFGVESMPGDTETVKGYWIVQDPLTTWTPDFVPSDEVIHIKLNVDSTSKRGLPTFMPIKKNLDRAANLLQAMNALGLVQSSYAVIRKHKDYSASAISAFQQGKVDFSHTDARTGKTAELQMMRPGSIIDTTANTDYEFPHAELNAGALVDVLQADLRAAASRLVMPEYMLTADASSSNYASTLVAEAPSTKNFEALQEQFSHAFGDGEYGDPHTCGVMWRVLRTAVEYGLLPRRVLRVVKIQVEGPTIVARNRSEETSRYKILNEAKVLSKSTWATHEGLDYDQETGQLEDEAEEGNPSGQGGQSLPGFPVSPVSAGRAPEEQPPPAGLGGMFEALEGEIHGGEFAKGGGRVPGKGEQSTSSEPERKKKERKPRPPEPPEGKEGSRVLQGRLDAAGLPLNLDAVLSDQGVKFYVPTSKKPPDTVAQYHPLTGGMILVDSPLLSEQEKMGAAAHELIHALDNKLGPEPFHPASKDPATPFGKLAVAVLTDEKYKADLVKLGYRAHELPGEALAYLGSRWAAKKLGEKVSENPHLDSLLPAFEEVLRKHGVLRETATEAIDPDEALLDCILLEAGFTGERRDKAGRRVCYADGKRVACTKQPTAAAQRRAMRPTLDQARAHIQTVKNKPTVENVQQLGQMLQAMPRKELDQLKREHGLFAGGKKAAYAEKIARLATKQLDLHETYAREARKLGVSPKVMRQTARELQDQANQAIDQINNVVQAARDLYKAKTGKTLTRNLKAFRDGDLAQLPGWDQMSRELAGQFPEVLGAHGYAAEGGYDNNFSEAENKLFDLVAAGPQKRLKLKQGYYQAHEYLHANLDTIQAAARKQRAERAAARAAKKAEEPTGGGDEGFEFGANVPAEEPAEVKSPHSKEKIAAAQNRYDNRETTGKGGGLFGGEDLQGRAGFSALPDGAPVLFVDGEFAGQTGKIVHDRSRGYDRLVATVDGREGTVPVDHTSVEPLNPNQSWRTSAAAAPMKQGSLLTADAFLPPRKEEPAAAQDPQESLLRDYVAAAAKAGGVPEHTIIGRHRVPFVHQHIEPETLRALIAAGLVDTESHTAIGNQPPSDRPKFFHKGEAIGGFRLSAKGADMARKAGIGKKT